jgi:hypothetical protein
VELHQPTRNGISSAGSLGQSGGEHHAVPCLWDWVGRRQYPHFQYRIDFCVYHCSIERNRLWQALPLVTARALKNLTGILQADAHMHTPHSALPSFRSQSNGSRIDFEMVTLHFELVTLHLELVTLHFELVTLHFELVALHFDTCANA